MLFVFCFSFILFLYLLLSVSLKRFYSFITNHSCLSLSVSLSLSFITFRVFFTLTLLSSFLHLLLSLSCFSSRLQLRFGLRRELRRSPNSPRVLLRRVREQAEAPRSLSSLFSPVLYDGSSDCRRSRRVILVRVRGPFRFRIMLCFIDLSSPSFSFSFFPSTSLPSYALLSFFALYRSYFYNRTYGRANVGYVFRLLSRNRTLS